jgi:hypothetical protein
MPYSATNKPAKNTRVIINPDNDPDHKYTGTVFTVADHAVKNVVIEEILPEGSAGKPRRVRLDPRLVLDAPEGATSTNFIPYEPPVPVGAVFTVNEGALRGVDAGELLVVIGYNGMAHKACRLGGGDGDRYFPKVARSAMNVIPADKVLPQLKTLLAVFA